PTGGAYDRRTRESFSHQWAYHDVGGRTWRMELGGRVRWFFLEPIRIPPPELAGRVMPNVGCGNGSQSVAYSALGLEVVAVDLSSGLQLGDAYRSVHQGADRTRVHFVHANLQRPPFAPGSFDLIHSAGVLHHTPNTCATFRALCPLL